MDLPPEEPVKQDDSKIPVPIVLSALYEFVKAAYIFYAFHAVWALHKAALATGQTDSDPLTHSPYVLILPVFALIMVVAGVGLLALQGWARHMFLFGGALALPWLPHIPLYAKVLNGPIMDYHDLQPYLPRQIMLAMIVLDALIYATLIMYPDVAQAFGEPGGDPYYSGDS